MYQGEILCWYNFVCQKDNIALNCLNCHRKLRSTVSIFFLLPKSTQIMVILPKIQFNLFSFSLPWGNFYGWLYIKLEEIFQSQLAARCSRAAGWRPPWCPSSAPPPTSGTTTSGKLLSWNESHHVVYICKNMFYISTISCKYKYFILINKMSFCINVLSIVVKTSKRNL